jgi:hypothetical protein
MVTAHVHAHVPGGASFLVHHLAAGPRGAAPAEFGGLPFCMEGITEKHQPDECEKWLLGIFTKGFKQILHIQ